MNFNVFQIITIPGSKSKVQFVFVDTVLLTNRNQSCSPPNDAFLTNAQWTWIKDTLAASTAEWLFVLGHYPGKNKFSDKENYSMRSRMALRP